MKDFASTDEPNEGTDIVTLTQNPNEKEHITEPQTTGEAELHLPAISQNSEDVQDAPIIVSSSEPPMTEIAEDTIRFEHLTTEQVTLKFAKYVLEQRRAYRFLPGAEQKVEKPSEIWQKATSVAPEPMSVNNQLDAEHLDVLYRTMIAGSPQLKNVGIFPIFHQEGFYPVAQAMAYHTVKNDPQFRHMIPDTTPLPERSSLFHDPAALQRRDNEEKKRTSQERALNREADRVLSQRKINIYHCFLKMAELKNSTLLGHPNHTHISFEQCEQIVFPFRINNNHYTIAVVKLEHQDIKQAKIQYYDSLGANRQMDEKWRAELFAFFHSKGFIPSYSCISAHDQRADNNCAIFALFKGLDVLNQNIGHPECRLANCVNDYEDIMKGFRVVLAEILITQGFNISIDKELKNAFNELQKKFIQKSIEQKQVEDVYRLIAEKLAKFGNSVIQAEVRKTSLTSSDVDAKFNEWVHFREELHQRLSSLLFQETKTESDNALILELGLLLKAYDDAEKEIQTEVRKIREREFFNQHSTLIDRFLQMDLGKTAFFLSATAILVYLFFPFIISMTVNLLSYVTNLIPFHVALDLLPLNPLVTIFGGAFLFTTTLSFIRFLVEEQPQSEPVDRDQEVAADNNPVVNLENDKNDLEEPKEIIEEKASISPPILTQFETRKEEESAMVKGSSASEEKDLTPSDNQVEFKNRGT